MPAVLQSTELCYRVVCAELLVVLLLGVLRILPYLLNGLPERRYNYAFLC